MSSVKSKLILRSGIVAALFALSISLSACGSNTTDDLTTTETTTIATTTEATTETTTLATTTETTTLTTTTLTTTTTEATTVPEPVTEISYTNDAANVSNSYSNNTADVNNNYNNTGSVDSSYSQTVYIGETGTKYHRQSCGTLKGNGRPITLDEALAQGREACKVCKP